MPKTPQEIVLQCRKEYENGNLLKRGRIPQWHAIENAYYGRVKKTLKGRHNVPIPVMPGFIETLISKTDDAPSLRYKAFDEAGYLTQRKIQSAWDRESQRLDYDWENVDIDGKKQAALYGRSIKKSYGESMNGFRFNINLVDVYDFFVDNMGGGDLEMARYCGEDNIFLDKAALLAGADDGYYDKENVFKLVNGLAGQTGKDNDSFFRDKQNRLAALGLTSLLFNFQGDPMEKFIQQATTVDGVRYWVVWNYASNLSIRCEPLKEVFESDLYPFTSWATNRDPRNFWSKAPADDMLPVAETIRILANQELDNRQKRNWGLRAYDPDRFQNAGDLEWRPDGLVKVRSGSSLTSPIENGIFTFETPELKGTIDLIGWIDQYVGTKTGVTAGAEGSSDQTRVGIYMGDMQQIADRMGLLSKSYSKEVKAIGRRFIWALKEHLTTAMAVKVVGADGLEWQDLVADEIDTEMDVYAESSSTELEMDMVKRKRKADALVNIMNNPSLAGSMNPKLTAEIMLLGADFTDEEVRALQDVSNDGSKEILARAAEAIEDIVEGEDPPLFRGATTAFQQKILDFALDNTEGDDALFAKLVKYQADHDPIVQQNLARSLTKIKAQASMQSLSGGGAAGAPGSPGAAPSAVSAPGTALQPISAVQSPPTASPPTPSPAPGMPVPSSRERVTA